MEKHFDFMSAGKSIMQSVIKTFWDQERRLAREELADPPESETAFIWPFCCFIEMLSEYDCMDQSVEPLYTTALEPIEKYKQYRKDGMEVYAALYGGYEDAYYDDNGWVVKTFLRAYDIFQDKKWLLKAANTIEYCYSGWDDRLGGGVYWRERDKLYKCLCSNAPLGLFSLDLYGATKDQKYFDWAMKLYRWSKKSFWEADGVYLDGIFTDGKMDRTKYPYNTAFMIRLETALYQITGNPTFLLNAEYSAHASFPFFCSPGQDGKLKLKRLDRPWFYMCLLEAYMELYRVSEDKEKLRQYIDFIAGQTARAYRTCRNTQGFISPDWWLEGGPAPEDIQIRDQSGMARMMFLLSNFYEMNDTQ